MGVFDKFLNIMKLDDEDDYDEYDEYDDYDDEDDYEPPKKSLFKRKEKDFDYDLEDEIVKETTKAVSKSASKPSSKITPINKRRGNGMEVCVIKPTTFEDSREITETLLSGRAVVLNFEGLDMDLAQRIIDYTCGSCVAIDGNLRKISNYIFIVTPKSVDISGDLQDLLTDAFDVPGVKRDF